MRRGRGRVYVYVASGLWAQRERNKMPTVRHRASEAGTPPCLAAGDCVLGTCVFLSLKKSSSWKIT